MHRIKDLAVVRVVDASPLLATISSDGFIKVAQNASIRCAFID